MVSSVIEATAPLQKPVPAAQAMAASSKLQKAITPSASQEKAF